MILLLRRVRRLSAQLHALRAAPHPDQAHQPVQRRRRRPSALPEPRAVHVCRGAGLLGRPRRRRLDGQRFHLDPPTLPVPGLYHRRGARHRRHGRRHVRCLLRAAARCCIYALNPRQETLAGALGVGVLTAVLSTPCTAPFMGTAAAWAATQAPAVTIATFSAIGAGMGLPSLLAAFPRLVRRVPKTGPGSELLKQAMAILMLAAAAYFIGIGLGTLLSDPAAPAGRLLLVAGDDPVRRRRRMDRPARDRAVVRQDGQSRLGRSGRSDRGPLPRTAPCA
ncbi:MAG: hypothetical protein MZU91_07935 [Desulfosudis oleivorans]|nr:hypothetical protein [Desulfosudis oleivorans]